MCPRPIALARLAYSTDVRPADRRPAISLNDAAGQPFWFNGQPVLNAQDLIQKVAGTPVGESAAFTFLRDRNGKLEKMNANVVLGERPKTAQLGEPDESAVRRQGCSGTLTRSRTPRPNR